MRRLAWPGRTHGQEHSFGRKGAGGRLRPVGAASVKQAAVGSVGGGEPAWSPSVLSSVVSSMPGSDRRVGELRTACGQELFRRAAPCRGAAWDPELRHVPFVQAWTEQCPATPGLPRPHASPPHLRNAEPLADGGGAPCSARARRPPRPFPPSRVAASWARQAAAQGVLRAFLGLLPALLVKDCVKCGTCVLEKKQVSPEKYTIGVDFGKYKL